MKHPSELTTMRLIYVALSYKPELVTGRYVRAFGSRREGFKFTVYECATGTGRYLRGPGTGPTLREYETEGHEIPEDLCELCIRSKQTQKWD